MLPAGVASGPEVSGLLAPNVGSWHQMSEIDVRIVREALLHHVSHFHAILDRDTLVSGEVCVKQTNKLVCLGAFKLIKCKGKAFLYVSYVFKICLSDAR